MKAVGTPAVTCVPLTKVVVSPVPFNDTIAPLTKPVPLTVKVNVGPPAVTVEGEMVVITGGGAMIANGSALETRLPLFTVTDAEPTCAIRAALTAAVNWVALTKVVASEVLFQTTVAPDAKPVPLTVRVKAAPPTTADGG